MNNRMNSAKEGRQKSQAQVQEALELLEVEKGLRQDTVSCTLLLFLFSRRFSVSGLTKNLLHA